VRVTDIVEGGAVAGEAAAAISTLVQEIHEGIASRSFAAVGVPVAPVRVVHDFAANTVYAWLGRGLRVGPRAAAALVGARAGDEGPALASTPRGARVLGVLNGLCGNHLVARQSVLAVGMGVRRHGRDVQVTPVEVAGAYPNATSRLAVFVHGLMEDDECWRSFPLSEDRPQERTYGERLQDEEGYTPVHVRYNTGLRISDNGRSLAALLDELLDAWPVEVEEIVLIGHSAGGLVCRSAGHYAQRAGRRWIDRLDQVFFLGSPHLGADIEKGLNALAHALSQLPETRGVARVLNARSVGIKDLRFGSCLEEDWLSRDPDEFLRDRCGEVPFLPGARYYFIAARVRGGLLGELFGDLLVRMPSASGGGSGRGRRIPFEVGHGCELTGLNHFELLNNPAVYEQLRIWISQNETARPAPIS
jgi:pimeloyl-ACP methyl ester carboxylesterase